MLLCRGQLISGTTLHMWERQTLHQELDLIPPDAVLVPPDERGLIDVKEDHVSPLQQLLAVQQPSPHAVVLSQHQPGSVHWPAMTKSLPPSLYDPVTQ